MSRIYALSSVKVQCWNCGCVKKWQIWGMSVGLSSNSVQCQKKLQILRLVQTRGSHKVQGRVCPRIHTSGARQPDRPLKANSRCKATWSALCCLTCCAGRERLDKFPFSMSFPFCYLYLNLLREDCSIFHSLAILHLLAHLSKSFWIWIWIRAYNVQSSSTPFLDKIQLNFVISLPWVRFKSQLGYKWMTENWEHQTWDFSVVAFRCFVQIPCKIDSLLPSSSLLYICEFKLYTDFSPTLPTYSLETIKFW